MRRWVGRGIVALAASVVLVAGCGDDTNASTTTAEPADDATTSTAAATTTVTSTTVTTTTTASPTLTASFRGVTAETIELGIAFADFDQLFERGFVDFTHGDEVVIWEALIADVNAAGGVLGRDLVASYETYLPIGPVEAEEKCLVFTEDREVFAVLGLWVGESVLCVTETHATIHVGHLIRQEWVDRSTAVLATADAVEERVLDIMLRVLHRTGRLEGRTVGVLTDVIAESSVDTVVRPFAEANDIELATVGVISDTTGDTFAVDAEIDTFTERWRVEGVDLLLVVGNNGIRSIPRVKNGIDGLEVAVPASGVLRQASGSAEPELQALYDGVLSLAGLSPTDGEQFDEPLLQECIHIVEAAVPDLAVVHPGELTEPDDWFAGIVDACSSLRVFVAAAGAAGPELTNDSFRDGLESLGPIDIPGKAFTSFGPDKWDGDDGFRLVAFHPLDGEEGSFEALTDIVDTASP